MNKSRIRIVMEGQLIGLGLALISIGLGSIL